MASLSSLIEITTAVLSTTLLKVTIPDKVKSVIISPVDVDMYFGADLDSFVNVSGTTFLGMGATDLEVFPIYSDSDPVKIIDNEDVANRDFYLAAMSAGSAKIMYEKKL
jgi:hypothetical protein